MVSSPLSLCSPQQWSLSSLVGSGSSQTPSVLVHYTLASLGCFHTANPSPLTRVWPPKPEPQHPAPIHPSGQAGKRLRLGSAGQHQPSVLVTLCFALLTPATAFSSEAPKLTPALPPPVRWLPCMQKVSCFTAPSQRCRSHPSFYLSLSLFFCLFSFALPSYVETFFCPFGSQRSSASVQ